jgi:hypothetical protein
MKKCWAYQAIAGSRSAWVPCVRRAEAGSHFCAQHARAIEGAVLGALMPAEACDQAEVHGMEEGRIFNTEGTEVRTQRSQRRGKGKRKRKSGM